MDLFIEHKNHKEGFQKYAPLAERCRPPSLKDLIGHEQIVGPDSVLAKEIQNSRVKSMILWGPPGVGKTTLAHIIANEVKANFRAISAVDSGVRDVRQVIDEATKLLNYSGKRTILFIDEIHRFNKAQQDALLSAVEKGIIILIGATTENPSFEVISPLLSRVHIYQLKTLDNYQIRDIVQRALLKDIILKTMKIEIEDWEVLYRFSNGDARKALNLLEKSLEVVGNQKGKITLDKKIFELAALRKVLYYDKKGEYHYDLISAFIKSLRGSDPYAAIYWMARMLEAGEDPKFIARRMLILASEDIGNADPSALTIATSCFTAVNYVGLPEAKIILSQVAAYLAGAPKSNAAVNAINSAIEDVNSQPDVAVPLHLRNAPTSLLSELGYGKGYQYAHDFPEHFVKEKYLPKELEDRLYYIPSSQGLEVKILERLRKLWAGIKKY
jgi:putative ATPase